MIESRIADYFRSKNLPVPGSRNNPPPSPKRTASPPQKTAAVPTAPKEIGSGINATTIEADHEKFYKKSKDLEETTSYLSQIIYADIALYTATLLRNVKTRTTFFAM